VEDIYICCRKYKHPLFADVARKNQAENFV